MSFRFKKQILLAQMLPHTCIGHPVASCFAAFGFTRLASDFHYFTLPGRAKRRLKRSNVEFNPDTRLHIIDRLVTPICSVLKALGCYRAADRVFRAPFSPHELATKLGACGYYYDSAGRNYNHRCKFCSFEIKEDSDAEPEHKYVDRGGRWFCSVKFSKGGEYFASGHEPNK